MENYFKDVESKNIMWQATVRYSDVYNMSEEEKELFVNALGLAVQKVCWDYNNMSEEEKELFVNALGLAVQKVCWDYKVIN